MRVEQVAYSVDDFPVGDAVSEIYTQYSAPTGDDDRFVQPFDHIDDDAGGCVRHVIPSLKRPACGYAQGAITIRPFLPTRQM